MAYTSRLDLRETQEAIKFLKDTFEKRLAETLSLTRVSAPLFVLQNSGLNDDLNGVERSVCFDIKETGEMAEVIHSLAKWKRYALGKYKFVPHTGLYTDMNAIRRDETCDALHSIYVDQWDWEKVINPEDRTTAYLQETVRSIYAAICRVSAVVKALYPKLTIALPAEIHFVTSQQLEDMYPDATPKERENRICEEYGAVFVTQIGKTLKSGGRHDGRAPDYDDWELNGDILVYYPPLQQAVELSSMGIRVDKTSLAAQLKEAGKEERLALMYHAALMNDEIPLTIGGGIGQSRLCMVLLEKAHVGEVQASIWPQEMEKDCDQQGIFLL